MWGADKQFDRGRELENRSVGLRMSIRKAGRGVCLQWMRLRIFENRSSSCFNFVSDTSSTTTLRGG